jgi:hypothetical protein
MSVLGMFGTLGALALAACADSTILGAEVPAEGGAILPPAEASADNDAPNALPEAGPDVDAGMPLCSKDGFCATVLPKGQHLVGVWSDGAGAVWTVSTEGNVLRWDGNAWTIHHQSKVEGFSIWGSGPTDIWVATADGILHGEGATPASLVFAPASDLPGDPNAPLRSIWGTGPSDIWAVGGAPDYESGQFTFYSRAIHFGGAEADGGTGWTNDDELTALGVGFRAVWGSPGTGAWVDGIGGDEYGTIYRVLRRSPGADTWSIVELPSEQPYALALHGAGLSSDSAAMISAELGVSEESTKATWRGTSSDNGATFTWTLTKHELWKREFFAYWGTAANDTWGVGAHGLVSHWDGTSWTQAVIRVGDTPVGKTFRAIWGKSNEDFWVVGDEIALHKTSTGKP